MENLRVNESKYPARAVLFPGSGDAGLAGASDLDSATSKSFTATSSDASPPRYNWCFKMYWNTFG